MRKGRQRACATGRYEKALFGRSCLRLNGRYFQNQPGFRLRCARLRHI